MFADTVTHAAEGQTLAIIVAGIVLALLGVAYRWMKKNVAEPLKAVPIIRAELHPNDGSSMRDSVDRNEEITANTAAEMASLSVLVAEHITEDTRVWAVIAGQLAELGIGQKEAAQTATTVADLALTTAADVKHVAEATAADVKHAAEDVAEALRESL